VEGGGTSESGATGDGRSGRGGVVVALGALQNGEKGLVHSFEAGHRLISRLCALGFTPGAEVAMLQNCGHGPVIVRIRDTRIALGRGEVEKILVSK
jgi:ferrous iron transport protein A